MKNIGIVTTWYERGAGVVSFQFKEILEKDYNVFIYARGEKYAKGNKKWDTKNVYWSKKITSPLSYYVEKKEFIKWIQSHNIDLIIFNEQRFWGPVFWCAELGVKSVAYVDYYTKSSLPIFEMYDLVICNTKRHFNALKTVCVPELIPWGTNLELYKPMQKDNRPMVLFHSCGLSPYRKGTDILLRAFYKIMHEVNFKLIIHTQCNLFNEKSISNNQLNDLINSGKLEIVNKTIGAPGLYSKGDIYVYPSRLDGLGLTLCEAISSGLYIVTSNNAPMNEFFDISFGKLIDIKDFKKRKDNYFWDMCEPDIDSLTKILIELDKSSNIVVEGKKAARNYALKNLDWEKNTKVLNDLIKKTERKDLTRKKELYKKSQKIDNEKYPFISNLHFIYSVLYKIYKKIRLM